MVAVDNFRQGRYTAINAQRGSQAPLRFRYQTLVFGNRDIHLRTLKNVQQYLDPLGEADALGISSANWPLFGVVWDSSQVLANFIADFDIAGKRILEVGCGMALSSHLLNQRNADISATDYHPETEAFLRVNTKLNDGRTIPYIRTGWADHDNELGRFDLIIGSDILYEEEHSALLADFIDRHANVSAEVLIVDPGRKQHARFSKQMVKRGYAHRQNKPEASSYLEKAFTGVILEYNR